MEVTSELHHAAGFITGSAGDMGVINTTEDGFLSQIDSMKLHPQRNIPDGDRTRR
jgi:hypothetical protein